jgi:hypothetical protein
MAISSSSYPLIKPENRDNIISEIIKKPPLRPINDFPFHTHLKKLASNKSKPLLFTPLSCRLHPIVDFGMQGMFSCHHWRCSLAGYVMHILSSRKWLVLCTSHFLASISQLPFLYYICIFGWWEPIRVSRFLIFSNSTGYR